MVQSHHDHRAVLGSVGGLPSTPSGHSAASKFTGPETLPTLRAFSNSANPSGLGGIENVDSIILIYDLDRDETFFRLENHWLPLIERCYNGNVSLCDFFAVVTDQGDVCV